jgi:hypothetical protein
MKTLSYEYVHTSESLKAQDGRFENYHYQLDDGERYAFMLSDDSALRLIVFYSVV